MAITIEQAMVQLQAEMRGTRNQLAEMAAAHDTLQAAVVKLEAAGDTSDQKIAEQVASIARLEDRLRQTLFTQKFDLLDAKALTPEVFRGRRTDAFKPWARKVRNYCNAKRGGFRRALEWAEKQEDEILDLSASGWEQAAVADSKLHDLLVQVLQDEPLYLIDTPQLESRGFEAWRLLVKHYAPTGGQ